MCFDVTPRRGDGGTVADAWYASGSSYLRRRSDGAARGTTRDATPEWEARQVSTTTTTTTNAETAGGPLRRRVRVAGSTWARTRGVERACYVIAAVLLLSGLV